MADNVMQYQDILTQLSKTIWEAAELKFAEFKSSAASVQALKDAGFSIETGIGGLETAFIGTYGSGRPVIGFLGEFDALDGLSQQPDVAVQTPRPGTTCGHGCGHHLLGTAAIGAGMALRSWCDAHPGQGTVKVFGCPGEEGGSGKAYMARAGAFDCLDAALTWHPGSANRTSTGSNLANCQAYFRFHGKASHAGGSPQQGRSALDAVEIMNVGVNYLREHMEMTDRVHYAVTNTGGVSPNVVQAEAEVLYLVRSRSNDGVKELFARVCDCAKGAALITGTQSEMIFDKACSNVLPNDTLAYVMHEALEKLGPPVYTDEEIEYMRPFREVIGEEGLKATLKSLPDSEADYLSAQLEAHPMGDFIRPFTPSEKVSTGSSDVGDVSQCVPTAEISTACYIPGTPAHSWLMVAQGLSSYAMKGMLLAAQAMANAAETLLESPDVLEKAKAEHARRTKGRKYVCPIPPERIAPRASARD